MVVTYIMIVHPKRTAGGAKQHWGQALKAGIDGGHVDKRTAPMY